MLVLVARVGSTLYEPTDCDAYIRSLDLLSLARAHWRRTTAFIAPGAIVESILSNIERQNVSYPGIMPTEWSEVFSRSPLFVQKIEISDVLSTIPIGVQLNNFCDDYCATIVPLLDRHNFVLLNRVAQVSFSFLTLPLEFIDRATHQGDRDHPDQPIECSSTSHSTLLSMISGSSCLRRMTRSFVQHERRSTITKTLPLSSAKTVFQLSGLACREL